MIESEVMCRVNSVGNDISGIIHNFFEILTYHNMLLTTVDGHHVHKWHLGVQFTWEGWAYTNHHFEVRLPFLLHRRATSIEVILL